MKKQLLQLLLIVFGVAVLMAADASAETTKNPKTSKSKAVADKSAPAKLQELTTTQQAEQAKQAAEAKAKAEQEAQALAEAETKARAEAEAEAKSYAEAKAKLDAETAVKEKPLSDAEALMAAGKPADAYTLLEPLEFERSGEVRFDYLIGIAALDSGKPDKATIAFERVLAVDPNFAGARLDMARAYYQLGDLPRAKAEFEQVMAQNPPDAAKTTIQKYMNAISAQEKAKQTQVASYVEGMVGHDTNINSAGQPEVSVSILGSVIAFKMAATNVGTPDNYYGIAAGTAVDHAVSDVLSIHAGVDLRQRGYSNKRVYDTTMAGGTAVATSFTKNVYDSLGLDARGGVGIALNRDNQLTLGASIGRYTLGGVKNRESYGYNAELKHIFSPANQMVGFGQYSSQRYVATPFDLDPKTPLNAPNDPRSGDTNQVMLGGSWLHILADGKAVLFGGVYLGKEFSVAPSSGSVAALGLFPGGGRPEGKKVFDGVRAGGQAAWNERVELFGSLGIQKGSYEHETLYGVTRGDQLTDLTVGANWHWNALSTVRPQIARSRNKSNVDLYNFDRTDYSVTVRRDFK